MQASDVARAVTQWSVGIKPTWTISEVRTALRSHAEGDFSLSAQLVDTFGEDDIIPGLEEKRVDAVLGSDFELCAVDEPNHQLSVRLKDRFEPLWWDMFPESEMGDLLKWYRQLGVAVAVLDWDRGNAAWKPTLRVLHPQFLRWNSFRQRFTYSAREGELDVTPGDGRWVLLTDGQRGWMRGLVRSLAIDWIAKQLAMRDWNRYNERHGLPIIKAFAPAIAEEPDQEAFWEDVKAIQSDVVAQLPTHLDDNGAKFDLELLEAQDGNWKSFEALIDRVDRRFMVRILGSNLSTEITTQGSQAAVNAHRGVEAAKATADAQKLSTDVRKQGLYPAIAFNVAGVRIEVIPWPKWDTEPPEDDKASAEAAAALGLAFKNFALAGYDIENLDEIEERYGVKLVKRAAPEPPAPTTPVAPDDGADTTDNQQPGQDAAAAE
jgi:hypothetical protein